MIPLMIGSSGRAKRLYVDDVFSAYPYLGTGVAQTINTGIDLAGKGGMVWSKRRSGLAENHFLQDTAQGVERKVSTNNALEASIAAWPVSVFNSDGFTISGSYAASGESYISWTFRNAKEFFQALQVTKVAGSNLTINLAPYMTTPGMVKVKRTDAAGSWYTWHRSLPTGQLLIGETTAAATALGHITVTGTTLTLVDGVIANGQYHIECYAHDASADGMIQCGSFTTDASGNATVTTGWEPQLLDIKEQNNTGPWRRIDSMRGFSLTSVSWLLTNAPDSEYSYAHLPSYTSPKATGFNIFAFNADTTYSFVAIRRPNKPPTSGTQVYNAIARNGTGAAATVTGVGFAPDLASIFNRAGSSGLGTFFFDKLRGPLSRLITSATGNESVQAGSLTTFNMDGVSLGINEPNNVSPYINHFFRRAPGVFDQICYGGTAANKTEVIPVLGVPAELWLVKGRSAATQWVWGSRYLNATEKVVMPSPAGRVTDATAWNSTYPTATALSLGTAAAVNTASATYTAYFWATLAGVSKVGALTKVAGASLNVDCGFTTGARFVMLFRVDAAGDFYLWDTARGIVAANDPYLLLNSTAAEVANTDWIDPYAAGFTLAESGLPAGQYIFLAYA